MEIKCFKKTKEDIIAKLIIQNLTFNQKMNEICSTKKEIKIT
jgi:hypothetical protein